MAGGGAPQGRPIVSQNQHRRWDRRHRAASRRGSKNSGARIGMAGITARTR
jgi:hypothetical protein